MSTVRDLGTGSMRLIGAVAEGESITAAQGANVLESLNDLIETLNLDNLIVYSITRSVFPLTIGQQSYTLGASGNFNMARPVRIENASVLITTSTPNIELPISIIRDEEWQDVTVKSVTSTFPLQVYPDGGFPFNTLYFWPIPTAACSVVLYTWNQLQPYSTLSDTVSLPNGYKRALRYLLARELAPEYGTEASPTVQSIAESSREWIRKQNWTPSLLTVDRALLSNNQNAIVNKSRGYVMDP